MNEYENINKLQKGIDTLLGWVFIIGKVLIFSYVISLIFTPRPKKIEVEHPDIEDEMKMLYEYYRQHGKVCPSCDLYYSKTMDYCVECGRGLVSVKGEKTSRNVKELPA